MKRTPLQRKTPMKKGAPLQGGGRLQADPEKTRAWQDRSRRPIASGGPIGRTAGPAGARREGAARPPAARPAIRAATTRKSRERAARARLVARLAAEGVRCEVCPEMALVAGVVVPGGCTGLGGLHERRKRSSVGTVEHAPNLIPCCDAANVFIEDEPELIVAAFGPWLVLRQRDVEWATCGRDVDPIPVTVAHCRHRGCAAAYVHVPPSGVLACGHEWVPDPDLE